MLTQSAYGKKERQIGMRITKTGQEILKLYKEVHSVVVSECSSGNQATTTAVAAALLTRHIWHEGGRYEDY